jgi:hypothetical protein
MRCKLLIVKRRNSWRPSCTIPAQQHRWKGAHREYWRDDGQQKLLDLDGIVDRCVDGPSACAGWKLRANARIGFSDKVAISKD